MLFKTGEYPEDPLPRQIGPSYHSLFSLPPLPAKTFKRAILEALEKETSASHKEAGFSSNLGIDYPHLYKHWRKCNLIRGFLWKFLSFQLPIGWKKEPCPFCGAKRESMRHLFGTCSALALQPPPFQAFLQSSTSSNFSHTALVLWAIWKARNKATHEGQPFSPSLIPIIYLQELE